MAKSPLQTIPFIYAAAAVTAGMILPRMETRFAVDSVAAVSVNTAIAIDSAVASGMMALTGIVFSLAFVMTQFSAGAYSPRLVMWISRDPLLAHSIGVFTATFLYAVATLGWVDRRSSGRAPLVSEWLVVALLLASVVMLILLLHGLTLLQVNKILVFTGDYGRKEIESTYASLGSDGEAAPVEARELTHTLTHSGQPGVVQSVDTQALLHLASGSAGFMEIAVPIGDPVVDGTPLLRVYGVSAPLDESALRRSISIGGERTFHQDPKYAIRLLVDIAIRALSPAVNDPTTAIQSLDQIEDLLLRLGRRRLDVGFLLDPAGVLRVSLPMPTWEDLLVLAFSEIRQYGATSIQVMRRMRALIESLIDTLPVGRTPALQRHLERIDATVARSFSGMDLIEASIGDREGLGAPVRRKPKVSKT